MKKRMEKSWTEDEIKLLGTDTDKQIAIQLRRSPMAVAMKRINMGIPRVRGDAVFVRKALNDSAVGGRTLDLLGKHLDREVVEMTGLSVYRIRKLRRILGIGSAYIPLELRLRNREIAWIRRTEKATLADLGERYGGLSRERIRQICEREYADGSQT